MVDVGSVWDVACTAVGVAAGSRGRHACTWHDCVRTMQEDKRHAVGDGNACGRAHCGKCGELEMRLVLFACSSMVLVYCILWLCCIPA